MAPCLQGDRSVPCQVSASRRSLCQRHKHIGQPTASSPRWHRCRSESWLMTLPTPCYAPRAGPEVAPSISTGLAVAVDAAVRLRPSRRLHLTRVSANQIIEVFSTDWSFGAGQDQCCGGDGADALRTQPDVA